MEVESLEGFLVVGGGLDPNVAVVVDVVVVVVGLVGGGFVKWGEIGGEIGC